MRLRLIPSTVIVASTLLTACGGDGPVGPDEQVVSTVALSLSGATFQPLQGGRVTFPSPAGAAGRKFVGTLGTSSLDLTLQDSVTAVFLVPDIAPGSYPLTVDFAPLFRGTATVTVVAPPPIADPKAAVEAAVAPLTERIDSVVAAVSELPTDSTGLSPAQIEYLRGKSAELKAALTNASESDLRAIALWLQANPDILGSITSSSGTTGPAAVTSAELSGAVDGFIGEYTAKKLRVVATIGGCAAGLVATGPLAVFAGVACGAAIAIQAADLANLVSRRLSSLYAIPEQFLLDASSSSPAGGASGPDGGPGGPSLVTMDPGSTIRVGYRAQLRTINSGDRGIVGALFSAVDEVTSAINGVLGFLPGFSAPSFGPGSGSSSRTLAIAPQDVAVAAAGCTTAPSGDGVLLTCSQVSSSDVSLTANFTYTNRFGSANATLPVTVRRTYVTVSPLQVSQTGTYRGPADQDPKVAGCRYTITIPVQGNTEVTFTTWQGVWSNGHTEGGTSNYVLDARLYSGLVWVKDTLFSSTYQGETPPPFTVNYTINYRVDATGVTGTVGTTLRCNP